MSYCLLWIWVINIQIIQNPTKVELKKKLNENFDMKNLMRQYSLKLYGKGKIYFSNKTALRTLQRHGRLIRDVLKDGHVISILLISKDREKYQHII